MKRFFVFTTIIILLLALSVSAEEVAKKKMAFGVTGGVSLSNATGSDAEPPAGWEKKMKLGFAGGVFVDFNLAPAFSLQPQLLYVQKGVKYDTGGVALKIKLDYLELPILLKWVPEMTGKTQPTIFAGPHFGYLMSAKAEDVDIKDSTKKIDFGVTFGAGFGTKLAAGGELFLDVRLDLGLSKIDDHAVQSNVKNTAFLAMVGYKFK